MIQKGKLSFDTPVWTGDLKEWTQAEAIPGLFEQDIQETKISKDSRKPCKKEKKKPEEKTCKDILLAAIEIIVEFFI